jgi:multisubunit Na+/H+ antiporter MnhG subunit
VLRLPDALTRQHGAALGVLTIALIAGGTALTVQDSGWTIRLALRVGAMMAMIPAAANMLARAAVHENGDEKRLDTARFIDR